MPEIVVGRDDEDMKKYGSQGTLLIGKHLVGTGEDSHMTTPVIMDAIRPHIILLTGKRGEGKCLMPGSSVLLSDGRLQNIEDVFFEIKGSIPAKEEEIIESDKDFFALSFNSNLDIVEKKITHVYCKFIHEKLKEIRTKSEKQITATKEHPLLVLGSVASGNLMAAIWKNASELKINDKIAVYNAKGNVEWSEVDAIKEIDYAGYVYDLTIQDTHNFIANEIVCHNSYSMGVIVEELTKLPHSIKKNICSVVIDTQGIFWTMKSPSEKDSMLLKDWGLVQQGFDVEVHVPEGQAKMFSDSGVDFDASFSVAAHELSAEDWLSVFDLGENDPLGILLNITLARMSENYSIEDIMAMIAKQDFGQNEKLALRNRFIAAKQWGIFGESKMPEMLIPGKVTIIDVSLTPQNVRALLVAMAARKLLQERIKARRTEELADIELSSIIKVPMPWLFIDEAHNFLPNEGSTAATEVLNRIVKEGRQPGITLVFATQRPEKLHLDAVAQADLIISHRLTAKADIDTLKAIMQTYLLYDIGKYINELPHLKGCAIILDDNSERLYKIRMRPRQSWHAGSSPVAI
jgi:uncharacterized protein